MRLFILPSSLLALLPSLLFPSLVLGDVEFTSPAAGADVAAGTINVQWKESGIAPPITSLMAYSLILMTGGDKESEMLALSTFVSQGSFRSGTTASGTIPAGIAGASPNGFFFKIISASSTGGTVINYSDRFSITGLNGYTAPNYLNAVKALHGSTTGPESQGDAISSSSVASPTTVSGDASSASSTIVHATTTAVAEATSSPSSHTGSGSGNNNQSGGSSISRGALAGIAIAGAAVGLIGIGLALWMCLRRKKQKESTDMKLEMQDHSSEDNIRREMSFATMTPPVELDPVARIVEADDGMQRVEMDSMNVRAELEGDVFHEQNWGPPLTPVPETPIECLTLDSQATLMPTQPRSNV